MDVRGLVIVGHLESIGAVTKKDGTAVPGMQRIAVAVAEGTRPLEATYFERDRYTGDETPVARQIGELTCEVGDIVAVRVRPRASGSWVNFDALSVMALEGA